MFLRSARQAHLVPPKDRQIQGKERIVFLGQDGALARCNGAVHPVNALVGVLMVAHGTVNAGHVVQEGHQEDKDFLKVSVGPGTLEYHVGLAIALDRHLEIARLAAANSLAVVAQAQVVQEDGSQAGPRLVAAFGKLVFID